MSTKVVTATTLKKGSYVILEGAPCKVLDIQISKPGKHGHAKSRVLAMGILDEKKREVVMPSQGNVEVPIIEKRTAQVLSVKGDVATVMDGETYETFDMPIDPELKDQCTDGSSVFYWIVMGTKVMKQIQSAGE